MYMGFVTIYMKNISEYKQEDVEHFLSMISTGRREVVLRKKAWKDQIRSAVCEVLLWRGLSDLGFDIEELAVDYREKKPQLFDRYAKILVEKTGMDPSAMKVGVDFSFTHSGDYVLCGISDLPIGVDVEKIRDKMPLYSNHVFSKEEEMLVRNSEDENREFLKYWTCKESYIKCAYPKEEHLRSVTLNMANLPYPILEADKSDDYYFETHSLSEEYQWALCVKTRENFLLNIVEL